MLPVDNRLRDNRDFRHAYSRGRSQVSELAVLYVIRRQALEPLSPRGLRVGFVVSKKQGNAVARNRIKRRLREAVRLRITDLSNECLDLVFVGRGKLKSAAWSEVRTAVEDLLRRARVLPVQSNSEGMRAERNSTKSAGSISCLKPRAPLDT